MTGKQAIKILKRANKWRRGAEIKMPDPKELGEAIDVAITILESYAKKGELDRCHIDTKRDAAT